jgi:hypothetical protein
MDQLVDLPEGEFLDELAEVGTRRRQAEVAELRMAYAWALRHPKERLDPAESVKPGREQARRVGGDGTPMVGEFAAATFGARLGVSPSAGRAMIADALDLVHRCPQLWARVEALEVRASYARHVVGVCRDLALDQARFVDGRVVEAADGRISWARFESLVRGAVVAADLEAARQAEGRAARATFVRRTPGDRHGMATLLVRADVATIEAIEQTVAAVAGRLGDAAGETMDERRVSALLLVVRRAGGSEERADIADLLPSVTLFVHTYTGADAPGIARIEGHGAVTEEWLARVLGPRARFTVRPVLDIEGQAPVDAYEIPDRHRRAVRLMTPADVFPFANCTSDVMQVDHTVPYEADGPPDQSRIGNYAPLTTWHHRIKTHGGWQVRQPFPGSYVWRDPYGQGYLVDHTGTRPLPGATAAPSPAEARWRVLLDLAA